MREPTGVKERLVIGIVIVAIILIVTGLQQLLK